jgi:hypothetical protein
MSDRHHLLLAIGEQVRSEPAPSFLEKCKIPLRGF